MEIIKKVIIEGAEVMYNDCGNLSLRFIVLYDEDAYNTQKSITFQWNLEDDEDQKWVHQLLDALETNGKVANLNGKRLRVSFDGHTVKDFLYPNKNESILYDNIYASDNW